MNKRELSEQLQEDFLAYFDGLENILNMDEICQMIVDRIKGDKIK